MTAQTTTQRTAKHRLAVKERMARYEAALREIADCDCTDDGDDTWSDGRGFSAQIARNALNPTVPAKNLK